ITDIFKYAARDLRANNDKIDSAVEEIAGKVISSIKSYAEIFYKYDEKKLQEINNRRYEVEKIVKILTAETPIVHVTVSANLLWILNILDLMESQTVLLHMEGKKI
ncbi:hypothetical protein HYV89_03480, partial [Candidatus Woesearchaeota archaeon]|nr:hypothetical protein [Candidatus Woesearchaeota archaeon]